MQSEGILTALAEVAVAIAGFSGIVVALQHRGGAWSENDKMRFSMLLQISLACVFSSLIPMLLDLIDPRDAFVWGWSSGLWLVYVSASICFRTPRALRAAKHDPEPPSKLSLAYLAFSLVSSIVLQVLNVGWLRTAWPHVLTIMLGLLLASVFFVRLLRRVVARTI